MNDLINQINNNLKSADLRKIIMSEIIIFGTVKEVDAEETTVSAAYTKRQLVVTTEEQYPQHIAIEFSQGKCNNQLDQLRVGQKVSVSINIGGREWINPQGEKKYFNSIKGWKVSINSDSVHVPAATTTQPQQAVQAPAQAQQESFFNDSSEDEIF